MLLAEPRKRPLPLMPAGRVAAPVIGLTGEAAKAALEAKRGAAVKFGRVSQDRARGGGAASGGASPGGTAATGPAPFSSRGPAFDGTPKPDVLAPGAAVAPLPGGGAALVAGTAVAAARVAVQAARLARARPAETAAGVREALVPAASAEASGAAPAPPVPLGPLRLTRREGEVAGVRFTLGAFDRGDPLAGGTRLEPAARLELALIDGDGDVRRRLTPPGGARDLLPAEYAYTLPARALERLGARHLPLPRHGPRAPLRALLQPPLAGLHRGPVSTVTLYTRPGCHLCDDARAAIERVRERASFSVVEIDIESDDALHRAYLERIPVVELDGEELFEHFVDEAVLAARVRSRMTRVNRA